MVLVLLFSFYSCTKDEPNIENKVPTVPVPVSPENYSLVNDASVTFSWQHATDPEGEELHYNLQLSDSPDFTNILFTDELSGNSFTTVLSKGKSYSWRIRAKDASNQTSEFSPRRDFIIRDETIENYAPFAPDKRFPELDESIDISQAKLGWISHDVDDTELIYNIYLGTEYGYLPLYLKNIEATEVTLKLDAASVYYWQVEVIDPSGLRAKSPVWWFKSS